MLTARISGLEGLVVGAGQTTSPEQLKVKIQSIIDEVGAVESKVPHLKVCRELLDKMQTDINKRKTTLDTVQERVRELLSGRAAIEEAISSLETLQQLASPAIINHDALHDIPSLQQRLDKIQDLLLPLIPEVQRQTEQIDSYLDTYEELMKLAEDLGREE